MTQSQLSIVADYMNEGPQILYSIVEAGADPSISMLRLVS